MSDLIKQTMAAGAVLRWQREAGLILIGEVSAPINVQLKKLGREIFYAEGVGRGVKVRPVEGFDEAVLHNATAGAVTLEVFITGGDVDVQIATGLVVTVDNSVANPVPVVHTGTVELTAANVGVNNTDANPVPTKETKAAAIVNTAPVVAGVVAAVLLAADADRREFRVRNMGAERVALGGAGVVFADAPIILAPGEMWIESGAPAAAWYVIAEANTADLNIQELTL